MFQGQVLLGLPFSLDAQMVQGEPRRPAKRATVVIRGLSPFRWAPTLVMEIVSLDRVVTKSRSPSVDGNKNAPDREPGQTLREIPLAGITTSALSLPGRVLFLELFRQPLDMRSHEIRPYEITDCQCPNTES